MSKPEDLINFELRDYQIDASTNVDEIYNRNEFNRFAAVVLATGGGKSFISIYELLSYNNPNYTQQTKNGTLNETSMLYVAPRQEILSQIKTHIVKYVLMSFPDMDKKTINELDSLIREYFPEIRFDGINSDINDTQISDNAKKSEKLNAIMRKITPSQIDLLVEKAFPNLKLRCFAGIKGDEEEVQDEDVLNADFIIIDEAHRLGASKWRPNFEANLNRNQRAKILAITATPERTDREGRNMMDEIARMIYHNTTVTRDKYMAQEIYVNDAIKDGVVNSPQVLTTNALLAKSDEYKFVSGRYKEEKNLLEKKKLEAVLIEMEGIIGFSPREFTDEQVDKLISQQIRGEVANSISNINGKYIAFLPANRSKDGDEKTDSAEFFLQYMNKIREDFAGVVDENGQPIKITFSIVTSNKQIKLDEDGVPTTGRGKEIVNSDVIKEFENASSESGGIKIILANDIFNEGIHVEGIDGALMYRNTDSSTVFLQQLGRCITSLDSTKPMEMQPTRQVFDLVGNSYKHITAGVGTDKSRSYDLYRIKQIKEWIDKNGGKLPDINRVIPENASNEQKAEAENEIRMAISLKRFNSRYYQNRNNENLPLVDAEKVSEIVMVANSINLWDIDIQERTNKPSEEDLAGKGFLELTDSQKRFMKLYRDARKSIAPPRDQTRINKLLNILKVLKRHNEDIKFPQGLYIRMSDNSRCEYKTEDTKPMQLSDFLKENFSPDEIKSIILDLQDYNMLDVTNKDEIFYPDEDYDFAEELAFVKGKVFTSQRDWIDSNVDYFEGYSLKYLIDLGLLDTPSEDLRRLAELYKQKTSIELFDLEDHYLDKEHNRIKSGTRLEEINFDLIKRFDECSLEDGSKYFGGNGDKDSGYDIDGYDKEGYDEFGYNRLGFNRKGLHKVTITNFDERGFYYDPKEGKYLNKETGEEYDLLGYNIFGYNEEGFERPKGVAIDQNNGYVYEKPLWHKRHPDGTYDSKGYTEVKQLYSLSEPKLQHDANGFAARGKVVTKNPLLNQRRKEGHFCKDGSTKIDGRIRERGYQLKENDFYLEYQYENGRKDVIDIDGFNRYGFKRVIHEGKEKYIHRDTSSIYDRYGRVFDPKTSEPKLDPDIDSARTIIQMLLGAGDGSNLKQCIMLYGLATENPEGAEENMRNLLNNAFEIYREHSPQAFDLDKESRFKGLARYYTENHLSAEKRERLKEFFGLCPLARTIVEEQVKIDAESLRTIQKRERQLPPSMTRQGRTSKRKKGIKERHSRNKRVLEQSR